MDNKTTKTAYLFQGCYWHGCRKCHPENIVRYDKTMEQVILVESNKYKVVQMWECEWKAIKPEALILQDDDYGTYLINETGTYIDRLTKNILIPFDANLATSVNISAAKLADDLKFIFLLLK